MSTQPSTAPCQLAALQYFHRLDFLDLYTGFWLWENKNDKTSEDFPTRFSCSADGSYSLDRSFVSLPDVPVPSCSLFVAYRLYIVYRQVLWVPKILHCEPSLGALSLRSDVMSSIKILSSGPHVRHKLSMCTTNPDC